MIKFKPALIGTITAAIMILLSLLFFYTLKLPVNGKNQYAIMAVYCGGIVATLFLYKMQVKAAGFKDYFQQGFKMFVVTTLLLIVFTYIFYKLNPQILEEKIIESNKIVVAQGNHTLKEIEENATKLRSIFIPMMLSITMFKNLILGALITAITGAFLSKK